MFLICITPRLRGRAPSLFKSIFTLRFGLLPLLCRRLQLLWRGFLIGSARSCGPSQKWCVSFVLTDSSCFCTNLPSPQKYLPGFRASVLSSEFLTFLFIIIFFFGSRIVRTSSVCNPPSSRPSCSNPMPGRASFRAPPLVLPHVCYEPPSSIGSGEHISPLSR